MWQQVIDGINQGSIQYEDMRMTAPLPAVVWKQLVVNKEQRLDNIDITLLMREKLN
jgi:hypothetical protein